MPRFKPVYGHIINLDGSYRNAARLNQSGRAEFVLWKAGEQGRKEDYWHQMGSGWEKQFVVGGYDIRKEYIV
jgi:hypothetical protein